MIEWGESWRNQKRLWEMRAEEKQKLDEFSAAIDKKIEEDMKRENLVPPNPNEIIKENPPLPELDVIKFAMEKGNDEIALWLKQGKEEGFLNEVMIGIALMKYNCPMVYEPEYSCIFQTNTWKELFHHFKNTHYDKNADMRHAKQLYYNMYTTRYINEKTPLHDQLRIKKEAQRPLASQLEPYLKRVENRLKWRDTAYAMLQECFVFEANTNLNTEYPDRGPTIKSKKRAAVLYRFQKTYGLTTKQIAKIFDLKLEHTRKCIYAGMMYEHGNKEENLPTWMQNALKIKPDTDTNLKT